jgi:RNA polymerase sigma-70 factor (ECF subfamily)
MAPPEDGDVTAAWRDGDRRRALALLMERHGDIVFRFALAMTRDRALAEDVRQQVFVEAYRDLETLAGRSSLRGWLLGISRRHCVDSLKKQRR